MSSILGPFFDIEPMLSVWEVAAQDVIQLALDNVANDVQSRVRSRIDTGIDMRSAVRAQAITVRNEVGQLVIKTDPKKAPPEENTTVNDLFHTSTQPPTMEGGQLIFRRLKENQLRSRNEAAVKSSVEDAMKLSFPEHLNNAIRVVKSENPEIK
jgi:hypothetical protein